MNCSQSTVFSNSTQFFVDCGFVISTKQFVDAISLMRLSDRDWDIVIQRAGLGNKKTLEEVGDMYGLTKERIRQIRLKAGKLFFTKVSLHKQLIKIEQSLSEDANPFSAHARENFLEEILNFFDEPNSKPLQDSIHRAIALIRSATPSVEILFPGLSFFVCALNPPVKGHIRVRKKIEAMEIEVKERNRVWPHRELMMHVMRVKKTPMHWSEIHAEAEALNKRSYVHPGTLMNILINDSSFVFTAPGTYALEEQGFEQVEPYIEVIWRVFAEAGQPLSLGEVIHRVSIDSDVPMTSLNMFLEMHVRFYRSVNEYYGLRIWLPEPSAQTLRTPKQYIEDQKSYKRVDQAIERGYHVSEILNRDREQLEYLT